MPFNKKTCPACDVVFIALRADAITCGARCRQRWKRHCDKITASVEAAKSAPAGKLADEQDAGAVRCLDCGTTREAGYAYCPVCRSFRFGPVSPPIAKGGGRLRSDR